MFLLMDTDLPWRERLHLILFGTSTRAGRLFDATLLVVVLTSLLVVMLESVPAINQHFGTLLFGLEWLFTLAFVAEYGLRVYSHPEPRKYIFSFFGIVDLLSILPAFLALILTGSHYTIVIRVLRLLRVFRVLKLTRYLSQANFLLVALRGSRQKIVVFLLTVSTLVVIYGTLMYVIEGPRNGFTSIPTGIYWAIVTMTTVGYGDLVPLTWLGKTLASLIMVTGYSIIAVPTGIFTAELASALRQEQLQHDCSTCRKTLHEPNAAFCSRCGSQLFLPREDENAGLAVTSLAPHNLPPNR